MSQLLQTFRALFRVQYHYTDLAEQQRARDLSRMTWLLILIELIASVIYSPLSGVAMYGPTQIVTILIILSLVVVPILINRGHLLSASLAFVVSLFVICLYAYIVISSEASLIFFSVPIIAAGVLLNRRSMIVMFGLVILSIMITAALKTLELLPPLVPEAQNPFTGSINTVISLMADGVMLVVFAGGQRAVLRQNLALTEEMRTSNAISQVLSGLISLDKILEQSIDLIRDQLGYYHIQIFLVEEKTRLLILQAGTTRTHHQGETGQRRIAPDDTGPLNEVFQTGKVMRISGDSNAARRKELLPSMQSELILPLRRQNESLGILDIQSIETDDFTEKDIEVLQAIAAQIALAVHNARLYTELQTSTQQREQLATQIREATQQIETLNRQASGMVWSQYLESNTEGLIGFDWQQGVVTSNSTMTPSLEQALVNALPEVYTAEDGTQTLSVPIVSRGQVLGVMEFRTGNHRAWSSRSIELARIVSQRLALALDNIRLFEQAQIIASREQMANQIAARLQAKTNVESVISVAAETFQQALGANRTSIRLGIPEATPKNNGKHV